MAEEQTSKRLTILVTAFNAVGHMNAVAGATKTLMERGHRMIFLVDKSFRDRFHPLGYEEHVYDSNPLLENPQKSGEWLANFLLSHKVIGNLPIEEKLENLIQFFAGGDHLAEFTRYNQAVKEAIDLYKPDLIYYDYGALVPAIYFSGIPWIRQISIAPTFAGLEPDLPPPGSGLPSTCTDPKLWAELKARREPMFFSADFQKNFILGLGYPEPYPGNALYPETQLLTVYAYPKELNYPIFEAKRNWINLEVFQHSSIDSEVRLMHLLPDKFMHDKLEDRWTGKFIYVTLGSMGSVDVGLMKRLIATLSKLNHKFIISLGVRARELTPHLKQNTWGEEYLPQRKLIPLVDLVITHGGNNTFTETFSEGKPMLVMPLFGDQYDNAQRLVETGLGGRVDPYNYTEEELSGEIERLLYDFPIHQKLDQASKRILANSRHEEMAQLVEKAVAEHQAGKKAK